MGDVAGRGRLVDGVVMLVVAAFSLALLIYVGWGEAQHALTKFQGAKLVAQGEVIQSKMEDYLRSGQPLGQFVGFRSLADLLMESDPSLISVIARDLSGQTLFEAGTPIPETVPLSHAPLTDEPQSLEDGTHMRAILPLRNKFETVGSLVVSVSMGTVLAPSLATFKPIVVWSAALVVILALSASGIAHWPLEKRTRWYRGMFAAAFLVTSVAVVWGLVGLYSEGARAKTQAMADSLDARLNEIVDRGLSIEDFSGIDRTMAEYRKHNPDIGVIAVIEDGTAIIHTDPSAQGRVWIPDKSTFEFAAPMHVDAQGNRHQTVMVTMPSDVVYWAIARNVKNFAVLFVATGLIALIFLKLAATVSRGSDAAPSMTERRLEVIEPVLFLGVFADNLSASFLPQLVTQSAHAAGMPSLAISTVFLLYFLAFSLSVLPAEAFAARRGPKPLIWGGGMLAALGAALLTVSSDFWFVALARVLSGCGQGLLLIGVQSYIFALSSPEKKTHGNSVIVFNFNGGMVSGMAIGSLLVFHMTMSGIFFLSMVILALLGLYAVLALPSLLGAPNRPTPQGANLWRVVSDRGFLSCIVLIGIPSKALLSGVIIFAMPLLLMKLDFRQEDIGQLIMFYAGGVMLANGMILRIVGLDRVTGKILMRGMLLSAAALAMIGVVGWDALIDAHRMPLVSAALVLVGVATLGVAHGFINAPVVTHVTTLPIAATIGPGAVAALYRTVERVGHVSGPVLIGQLLFIGDYDPKMLLLPAAMLLAAAVGFRFSSAGRVRAR